MASACAGIHASVHTSLSSAATKSSGANKNSSSPSVGLRAKTRLHSSFLPKNALESASRLTKKNASSARGLSARANLLDFVGGDLLGFDLGKWYDDVETYGSIGFYSPPEGGFEGRYATILKEKGYHFMNISARGLGDPEAYLTKIHGVRPSHLGKEPVARFFYPPEVDYRLSVLPKSSKGLVLWIGEAKVLAKNELQYLALLPTVRPNVRVIAELGSARKFVWKPLKDVSGLP